MTGFSRFAFCSPYLPESRRHTATGEIEALWLPSVAGDASCHRAGAERIGEALWGVTGRSGDRARMVGLHRVELWTFWV
jgi:hypothetical protein